MAQFVWTTDGEVLNLDHVQMLVQNKRTHTWRCYTDPERERVGEIAHENFPWPERVFVPNTVGAWWWEFWLTEHDHIAHLCVPFLGWWMLPGDDINRIPVPGVVTERWAGPHVGQVAAAVSYPSPDGDPPLWDFVTDRRTARSSEMAEALAREMLLAERQKLQETT